MTTFGHLLTYSNILNIYSTMQGKVFIKIFAKCWDCAAMSRFFCCFKFVLLNSKAIQLLRYIIGQEVMKTTALRRIFIIIGSLRVQHIYFAHILGYVLAPATGYRDDIIAYIFICNTM